VSRTLTYAVEIAVGLACFGAAAAGRTQQRWLAAVLVVAGVAAVGHGAFALVT
jgi:hypothetical protein